jgi:glycosyltransferase involved in cell wall biosynthesis
MNILFLSKDYPPNLIGGVGIYTLEMSRLLARNGHNVFVITSAVEFECEYIDKGVRVFRVKPKRSWSLGLVRHKAKGFIERLEYSLAVSKKIAEIHKRFKIDVVESCEARAEGFWYFFLHRRPKLVVKLHTPESIVFKLDNIDKNIDFKLIEILENWWIERADRIVGLTDAVIDLTRKYFNISRNHFPKVANPVDIDCFKPQVKKEKDREKVILYAGRLEFRKGVHVLAKAIPFVLKEIPEAKFIFIGSDCGMKHYILRKIIEFNCGDSVVLKEEISRENLVNYYQNSSACVIPSLWENHPYVCLEAMSCGIPVIASRVAGLAEIIKDRETGILLQPGSFKELSRRIIELLKDEKLRHAIGTNARKCMELNYTPGKIMKQTLDIYEDLINK